MRRETTAGARVDPVALVAGIRVAPVAVARVAASVMKS